MEVAQRAGAPTDLCHYTTENGTSIQWKVDKGKLHKNDRQIVSPSFNLDFGEGFNSVAFKIVLQADQLGSFKQSKGKGEVMLKCEPPSPDDERGNVHFSVAIGDGENFTEPRGPIAHNFSKNCLCKLSKDQRLFDFEAAAGPKCTKFTVCIQLAHTTKQLC